MCLAVALGVAGCAGRPGVVFDRTDTDIRWPPPPDTARIAYVGQLISDADLKPAKSLGEQISTALFGEKPAQGMVNPIAVCADDRGRVFIADSGACVVHVFDLETRDYDRWTPPEDRAHFVGPVGVAVDNEGRLLVCDSVERGIFVFDAEGEFLGTLSDVSLERPVGLAIDRTDGRVFVADVAAHEIVVLASDGELITRLGRRGAGPGEFNFPTNVALDSARRLYVSDSLNFRVQVFDENLKHVRTIGAKGDLPGYFAQPKGLGLDAEDHLYVVDANFEAVQVFDRQGRLLMDFGREGHGPGEFWLPAGLFIDAKGWIWIADSYNRRVQVFEYLQAQERP